jgi:DNA-binding response OmpR family regulator
LNDIDTGMACPHCGGTVAMAAQRQGLTIHTNPLRIEYKGKGLPLTPLHARTLATLIRFGKASHETLEALTEEGTTDTVYVVISHLRKRLPADVRIATVWGWGYALEAA